MTVQLIGKKYSPYCSTVGLLYIPKYLEELEASHFVERRNVHRDGNAER